MSRRALFTPLLAVLAACRTEPAPAPEQAVLDRLDEIDARIDELEARLVESRTARDSEPTPFLGGVPELATAPYDEKLPKKIRLRVSNEGVQFGRETLTDDELTKRLEAALRRHGDPTVLLQADPELAEARVEAVLALVRRAGIRRLAIATASSSEADTDTATGPPALLPR